MASIKYNISGRNDNTAINQAKNGLLSLGEGVNKLNTMFNAFVGLKVIQGLGKAIGETTRAFGVQQAAISQLTNAAKNNENVTTASLKRIIDFTGQLQKKGIYGDEELQKQATYLTALGLTEQQIKGVLEASANLASSGIMPLDAAVKNMAKQFGGMAGELGEKIPALRALTAEQLKAGEGIALVQKQFAGALETAAATLDGRTTQVQNILGDMKEKVGAVFGEMKLSALNAIQPFLEKFDAWLDVAKDKVINVLRYFPEILPQIGQMLATIGKNLFNIDYLFGVINSLGEYIWKVLKATFTNIGPLIVEGFKEMWNSILYLQYRLAKFFDLVGAQLSDAFMSVAENFVNAIIKGINDAILTINKIPGIKIGTLDNVDFNTNKAAGVKDTTGDYNSWKAASWSGALKANPNVGIGESLSGLFKDVMGGLGDLYSDIFNPLTEGLQEPADKINEILNRTVDTYNVVQQAGVALAEQTTSAQTPSSSPMSLLGDMNPIALLMDALKPLISMFQSMNSIKMILDPLQIVFQAIFDVLSPIIDSLLRPLIGIFRIIGETIGKVLAPILIQLSPVIELISKAFVFLYNYAIRPLANAIIWVVSTIYNMVANLVNAVLGALDRIPFVDISWRMSTMNYDDMKLDKIEESSLDSAGARAGTGYSSGGASASYTGPSNITNNFYIDVETINGTNKESAIIFWDTLVSLSKTNDVQLKGVLT